MSDVNIKCPFCQKEDEYDIHENCHDGLCDGEDVEIQCHHCDRYFQILAIVTFDAAVCEPYCDECGDDIKLEDVPSCICPDNFIRCLNCKEELGGKNE